MKEIPVFKVKNGRKKIPILFTGDWHLGHEDFDEAQLKKHLQYIKQHRGYIVLMGDLGEYTLPIHMTNSSAQWQQRLKPDEQIDEIIRLLIPVQDRIIAATRGNHEDRIYNRNHIDPMKIICDTLGVPIYLPVGGYFTIKTKDINYNIAIFHGFGGSMNPRYLVEKAMKIWTDADIIAIGHNHGLYHEIFYKYGIKDGEQTLKEIHGIRTGGFLDNPDYAQSRLYPPCIVAGPVVMLYSKDKIISPNISGFITKTPAGGAVR